jgi:hypothetical protein
MTGSAYCAADARMAEYAFAIPSALESCERHKTTNSGTIFRILNPLNGYRDCDGKRDCEGKVKAGKHAQLAEFPGNYLRYCPEFPRSCKSRKYRPTLLGVYSLDFGRLHRVCGRLFLLEVQQLAIGP